MRTVILDIVMCRYTLHSFMIWRVFGRFSIANSNSTWNCKPIIGIMITITFLVKTTEYQIDKCMFWNEIFIALTTYFHYATLWTLEHNVCMSILSNRYAAMSLFTCNQLAQNIWLAQILCLFCGSVWERRRFGSVSHSRRYTAELHTTLTSVTMRH